jgi:hypothetical protein
MSKLDDLIKQAAEDAHSPSELAFLDQSGEMMKEGLQQLGIDTSNPDQMRGVLGGLVLVAQVRKQFGGDLSDGALGAAIQNVTLLQPS